MALRLFWAGTRYTNMYADIFDEYQGLILNREIYYNISTQNINSHDPVASSFQVRNVVQTHKASRQRWHQVVCLAEGHEAEEEPEEEDLSLDLADIHVGSPGSSGLNPAALSGPPTSIQLDSPGSVDLDTVVDATSTDPFLHTSFSPYSSGEESP